MTDKVYGAEVLLLVLFGTNWVVLQRRTFMGDAFIYAMSAISRTHKAAAIALSRASRYSNLA